MPTLKYKGDDGAWHEISSDKPFTRTKNGAVPAPGGTDESSKFLCEDGTWKEPIDLPITEANIADGAITANKLAPNSVNSSKIVDGSITSSDLASNAVTNDKIAGTIPVTKGGTGVTTDKAIALKAYPIGSLYFSSESTSPGELFGGTWVQLDDERYLRLGKAFNTGGNNTWSGAHNHTQASHSHSIAAHGHTVNSHAHTLSSHTHSLQSHTHSLSSAGYAKIDIGQGDNYYIYPRMNWISSNAYYSNYRAGIYSGVGAYESGRNYGVELGGRTDGPSTNSSGGPSTANTSSESPGTSSVSLSTDAQTPIISSETLSVTINPLYQDVYAWRRIA